MRIECPNCRRVCAISSDLIVTQKRGLELSCSVCKADFQVQLSLPAEIKPEEAQRTSSGDSSTRLASPIVETEENSKIISLKSKILRGLVELPPMPNIILKAREIMEDSGSSLKDLAGVIEHDQAIVARVLALANSSYYGLSGKVSSIQHASVVLGQNTLGELITMAGTLNVLGTTLKGYGLASGDLWLHSIAVAFGSRLIAEKKKPDLVNDLSIKRDTALWV